MLPVWVLSRRSRPCFLLGASAESPGVLGGRASGLMRGTICALGQLNTYLPSYSNCRDVAQAADVAIEHRNEAEMSLVLSHCTGATDGATADKIQRARAQAQKK